MNRPHVLIVDDDGDLLVALARSLTARRCDVRTSNSPLGVSTLVRSFRPDVIIIDFDMPALDGDRLARLIRTTHGSETPIIFHSGRDPSTVHLMTSQIPNCSFIAKPASPANLHAAIRTAMNGDAPAP